MITAVAVILWLAAGHMDQRIKSYLRPLRRKWALTQEELGFLIGGSDTSVSRIEQAAQTPTLSAAFACALIFDTPPLDLFPGFDAEVRKAVHERASELYEQLQGDPSRATRVKLDFLENVLARLEHRRAQV
jgi:transcriptional regulator with XRE-family HTH domain